MKTLKHISILLIVAIGLLQSDVVYSQGDSCANAILITSMPYTYTGTTCGFGDNYSYLNACGSSYLNGDDILFVYTPTTDENVNVYLTTDATWVGVIISLGCPAGGTCVGIATNSGANANGGPFAFTAGNTYYFTVSSYPSPQCINNFTLNLNTDPFINCSGGPPCNSSLLANDICSSATLMSEFETFCGNTNANYSAGSIPSGFCGSVENNSWFKFIASDTSANFNVFVCNCEDGFGIQMEIYSTTDCINFTSHSNCWNPGSQVNGTLLATGLVLGETYYIMIDGNAGDVCEYTIEAVSGVLLQGAYIIETGTNNAGICSVGETLHLQAYGGTEYHWSPTAGLSNPDIANPIASPTESITYTCAISGDSIPDTLYYSVNITVLNELTIIPGLCNSNNNIYSLSGELSFSGIPNSEYIVITDSSGVSETLYPPFSNPLQFTLNGLIANGAQHTVTVSFADQNTCVLQTNYTAPVPCSVCTVFAGNDEVICGLTTQLNAVNDTSNQTQTWTSIQSGVVFSDDQNANSQVSVPDEGTYHFIFQVTNDSGLICSDTVTYIFNLIPHEPVISYDNYILSSDASVGNQWYNQNGLIAGATDQTYTPTVSGTYYCVVEINGCSSQNSNSIQVIIAGIETHIKIADFILYPNPANNLFYIELDDKHFTPSVYHIYNSTGQQVLSGKTNNTKTAILTQSLPDGIYTISVMNEKWVKNVKLVIYK